MKTQRTVFGLAALAALLALAVVGASPASAMWCSTSGTGANCAAGHGKVYTGTFKDVQEGPVVITTKESAAVECAAGEDEGEVTNGASSPALGQFTSVTMKECTHGLESCTVSSSASPKNPWPFAISTKEPPDGTMVIRNVTLSVVCGMTTCDYAAEEVGGLGEITVTGGHELGTTATTVTLPKQQGSSLSCPTTTEVHSTLKITSPTSVFFTQ
jgi:hypothetical protein